MELDLRLKKYSLYLVLKNKDINDEKKIIVDKWDSDKYYNGYIIENGKKNIYKWCKLDEIYQYQNRLIDNGYNIWSKSESMVKK